MRALFILNPAAGGGRFARQITELELSARMHGHAIDVVTPTSADETICAARAGLTGGYDRILVGGGDGTVNGVATVLAGTKMPLGILPLGTVNVLARALGIPLDPQQALLVALGHTERRIDVGTANGQPFLLMGGLGFDGQVIAEVTLRQKELFGPLAYIAAGLQVLTRHKPSDFHIEAPGRAAVDVPAWLVIVANAGLYAYDLSITPEAQMDDGLLDICLFAERNVLDRLTELGAVLTGLHSLHPNVTLFRASRLHITASPNVPLQLDGDPAGISPVTFAVQPGALRVATPVERPVCPC